AVQSSTAPPRLTRYQGIPSLKIEGEAAPGASSGEAMAALEQAASSLPQGFEPVWTGLSLQERRAEGQAPFLYAVSLLAVLLCLAALYESWSVPLAVMLAAPAGIAGALAGVFLRGMYNDVYFHIALLTIVGLTAKNAILIVEFAKSMHESGRSLQAAAVEAARLRFRPIIMTSLCFMLGTLPLAFSTGAGAGAQNALGTAVVAGMIAATGLGVYFTPIFFVLVARRSAKAARSGQGA
ncbi:MAG: efflux RND transporter permease subunit, partial [Desulfovibrio sp.]|nr:efflux RND transporter permease subunit [Desulfovibrio sp.]